MIYDIKEFLKNFFTSRLFVLGVVVSLLFAVIIGRVFTLQIINGESYQDHFILKIQKDITIEAARGNIYDCNGNLLAYNELAYTLVVADNQTYNSTKEKNLALNAELAEVIQMLLDNHEEIYNTFGISYNATNNTYSYNVSGTSLKNFLVNVFGEKSYDDLTYNETFGFNEATATPEQVMDYLMHDKYHFGINQEPTEANPDPVQYSDEVAYYLVVLRYALLENRYTRYVTSVVAKDISDKTVAYMNEHSDSLEGFYIEENTIRKYNYSEYFSNIIGYTGTISEEEYEQLSKKDSSYTISDTIGRSGIEQYYESYLRGTNGEQSVYVDNVGRINKVISEKDAIAGSDIYLSIDAKLQKATYKLLEQELAGIIYANIRSGDIPITDVYFSLIDNSILDISHFSSKKASDTEKQIQSAFASRQKQVLASLKNEFFSDSPTINNKMDDEMLDDITYIVKMLKNNKVLLTSEIDSADETYKQWSAGNLSPAEYFKYCISNQWVDITKLSVKEEYADTSEVYTALVDYIIKEIGSNTGFAKITYNYMVHSGTVSGRDLCIVLYDQGVLDYDENYASGLNSGSISPYDFLLDMIDHLELTPAQLALDPCTASCVITDTKTGSIKALVSYPGYDNNKMANGVDAKYYERLQSDKSNPLYNYATQEKTACGSTFKMITATASLAEGMIDTDTRVQCTGVFDAIDNHPRCWIYPAGTHGNLNVSEALRDSCNIFFYTCGYNLATKDYNTYDDASGIKYLQKYAKIYGLNDKTGIEIQENKPEIATEYPVMAAIGQSNNNYTTVSLSRYVTALVSGNLYDYQLMNKIVDTNGKVLKQYEPKSTNIKDTLKDEQWDSIYTGMRMVVEDTNIFNGLSVNVAGKTGTAQQVTTRPNHALFVGYAPYENPEITIAVRISYGYTSHNAEGAAAHILSYYFKDEKLNEILSKNASGVNAFTATENFTD